MDNDVVAYNVIVAVIDDNTVVVDVVHSTCCQCCDGFSQHLLNTKNLWVYEREPRSPFEIVWSGV